MKRQPTEADASKVPSPKVVVVRNLFAPEGLILLRGPTDFERPTHDRNRNLPISRVRNRPDVAVVELVCWRLMNSCGFAYYDPIYSRRVGWRKGRGHCRGQASYRRTFGGRDVGSKLTPLLARGEADDVLNSKRGIDRSRRPFHVPRLIALW